MAKEKPTTQTNDKTAVALSGLPVFVIPDDAEVEERKVKFLVRAAGKQVRVNIENWCDRIRVSCHGSWDALEAAGIVKPDWFAAGHSSSWCVAFDGGVHQVRIRGRGCPKGQYMRLFPVGFEYGLYWRVVGSQAGAYKERIEGLWASSHTVRQQVEQQQANDKAMPAEVAQDAMRRDMEAAIDWWKGRIKGTGCRYTEDSLSMINLALEAVRRAVNGAKVVSEKKKRNSLRCVGNVVYWPGRGTVAPVVYL